MTGRSDNMVRIPGSVVQIYCEFERNINESYWFWRASGIGNDGHNGQENLVEIVNGEYNYNWSKILEPMNINITAIVSS